MLAPDFRTTTKHTINECLHMTTQWYKIFSET
jgi:hypothetical protein